MDNLTEALKIAFAVILFVLALSLSMSSFSQTAKAANSIIKNRDKKAEYIYVNPSKNLTRKVGIETVVTSLYRINEQNLEIHFYKKNGSSEEPIPIFNQLKANGLPADDPTSNYIELAHENLTFGNNFEPNTFIDVLLGGEKILNTLNKNVRNKYKERLTLTYKNGLYDAFKDKEFEERLGEYVQGSGTTEITKRVITYVMQ